MCCDKYHITYYVIYNNKLNINLLTYYTLITTTIIITIIDLETGGRSTTILLARDSDSGLELNNA